MPRTGETVVRDRGAMDWDKQSRDSFRLSVRAQNVNKKSGNVHKGKQ